MNIIPSINVKTKEEFEERVRLIEPHFSHAHLDIADGIFVNNKTIDGFLELEQLETEMTFGVHLMVSKPENHIKRWLETPATSFSFHVEATAKHLEVIEAAREGEGTVGIALNPQTAWKDIEPFVNLVDFVQFMTVEPGFNGGEYLSSVVEKITDFHFYYPDKRILADGGITPDKTEALTAAGVTDFVVGHDIKEFINA